MPAKKKETTSKEAQKRPKKQKPKADKQQRSTKPKPSRAPRKEGTDSKQHDDKDHFPIVGIGASAGGLQALENFFARLPADCNMAFVIVQHLDRHHESLMNSLLSKETFLKITPKETENRSIFALGDDQWNIPALRKFLEEFPGFGQREMALNARKIEQGEQS